MNQKTENHTLITVQGKELKYFLNLIMKRRLILLSFVMFFIACSILYSMMVTPTYQSSAIISLGKFNSVLTEQETARIVILSNNFLSKVAKELGMENQPLGPVLIENVKNTKFLKITATSTSPDQVQSIAGKIISLYSFQSDQEYKSYIGRIDEQMSSYKNEIGDIETQINIARRTLTSIEQASIPSFEADMRRFRVLDYIRNIEIQKNDLNDRVALLEKEKGDLKKLQIIKPAEKPLSRYKPDIKQNIVLSGMIGLIVGLIAISLLEYLKLQGPTQKEG